MGLGWGKKFNVLHIWLDAPISIIHITFPRAVDAEEVRLI